MVVVGVMERDWVGLRAELGLKLDPDEDEIASKAAYFLACLYNGLHVYIGSTGVKMNGLMIRKDNYFQCAMESECKLEGGKWKAKSNRVKGMETVIKPW